MRVVEPLRHRKVHSPQNRGEDAGDGVEDEHPHHADPHTGKDVRCEDDGSGDVTSHQLTVEDDGQPEADEHGESDGGDGEDEGRRQDSAGVASEELDVVLQPDPSGIGRTEGPVESRVVDVQEERSVDEQCNEDRVRGHESQEEQCLPSHSAAWAASGHSMWRGRGRDL